MFESIILTAFVIGLISALSLPMGAAETMMLEAYFKGGSVVGMSTLLGFLVAVFSNTLE